MNSSLYLDLLDENKDQMTVLDENANFSATIGIAGEQLETSEDYQNRKSNPTAAFTVMLENNSFVFENLNLQEIQTVRNPDKNQRIDKNQLP